MTNPARFSRRLSLEAPVETADGAGGVTRTFEAVALVWAEVTPLSAGQDISAAALGAKVTCRITIRAGRAITNRHRFVDGETVYRVIGARESEDRRLTLITAETQTF
jgi:SPP1 family predicted phage head-tail adaptor